MSNPNLFTELQKIVADSSLEAFEKNDLINAFSRMPDESFAEIIGLLKGDPKAIHAMSKNLQIKLAALEHGNDDVFAAILLTEKEEIESK